MPEISVSPPPRSDAPLSSSSRSNDTAEKTTARSVADDLPPLDDQALRDVRQSLDAMGRVCPPVLFGLLAPGGVAGLLLLSWLLFA
jgi:hypothetical protein